jgi:hypothetical protein
MNLFLKHPRRCTPLALTAIAIVSFRNRVAQYESSSGGIDDSRRRSDAKMNIFLMSRRRRRVLHKRN